MSFSEVCWPIGPEAIGLTGCDDRSSLLSLSKNAPSPALATARAAGGTSPQGGAPDRLTGDSTGKHVVFRFIRRWLPLRQPRQHNAQPFRRACGGLSVYASKRLGKSRGTSAFATASAGQIRRERHPLGHGLSRAIVLGFRHVLNGQLQLDRRKPWKSGMRTSFAWGFLAMAAMLAGLDRASAQSESLPIVAIKPAESKVQEGSDPIKFTLSLGRGLHCQPGRADRTRAIGRLALQRAAEGFHGHDSQRRDFP